MSWSNVTSFTETWTGVSSKDTPGWKQLHAFDDGADGYDFTLVADEQYPFILLADTDNRHPKIYDSGYTKGV